FIDTVSWWLAADPISVAAAATTHDASNLAVTLQYSDGSVATISYLTTGDGSFPKERIEVFGDGRAACFDNFSRYEIWREGRVATRKAATLDKGQKAEVEAFVAAAKNGSAMPIDLNSLIT